MRPTIHATSVTLAAMIAVAGTAAAQDCPEGETWPSSDWSSRAAEVAQARPEAVAALEDYAFTLEGEDAERLGVRTDGLVIVLGGEIVYEGYGRGFAAHHKHIAWSVSKSITQALLGVAVDRGDLHLDDSICDHLETVSGDACDITVRHLYELSSGLDWLEDYEDEGYAHSSVLAMLYGQGYQDMPAFVASHPFAAAPGERYVYSTGEVTLLSSVIQAATQSDADTMPWTYLFDPIGMGDVTFERDGSDHYMGGSHVYATPRDFARFGLLYLRGGCWNTQRVLSEEWVTQAHEINPVFLLDHPYWDGEEAPGRLWWLNQSLPEEERPWPDVPADAYSAVGHWGQYVAVIPSLDMVVVRTGDDRDSEIFDMNRFLSLCIAVATGGSP